MKRHLFILAVLSLSICVSGCFNKQNEESADYQGAGETSEETGGVTGTADIPEYPAKEVPAEDVAEIDPASVNTATPFVRPSDEDIQTALKSAGYYTGAIDGKIGPLSEKAIKDFQTANGLVSDGKVGRKTWAFMGRYLNTGSK